MATIAELLERHREALVQHFTEEASQRECAQVLTRDEVLDTLPEYLEALTALALDWRREDAVRKKQRLEATHIGHRRRVGYNQQEATAEYLLLGRLISSLWEPLPPEEQPTPEDKRHLFTALQAAMDHVVTVFSGYGPEDRRAEKETLRRMDALARKLFDGTAPHPPPAERLGPLLELLQEAMGADAAALMLVDEDGERLVPAGVSGRWNADAWREPVALGSDTFVAQVAATDEPVFLPDALSVGVHVERQAHPGAVHSMLGLRMWPYGRLVGVACIGLARTRAFEPRARRYFEVLVEHLAGIVERLRLLWEFQVASASLRESESRSRLAALAASDAIFDWNMADDTVFWGEGSHALFGYAREELGREAGWWWERLHPEDRERLEQGLRDITFGPGQRWQARYRFRRADGEYTELSEHGWVERDAATRRAVRMVGTMRDVSEGHAAEVRDLDENRWWLIIETTGLGTWDYDVRTGEARFDGRTKALFGMPAEAPATREELIERIHPDDRERMHGAIAQALEPGGRGSYSLEYRTVELPGVGMRWVGAHGKALFDATGQPVRVIGTVMDITERVREREAAERERLKVVNILESISDAFIAFDGQWRFTYANREAERILGMPREAVMGRSHWEVFPATLGTPVEENYRRAMEKRVPVAFENFYAPWERWFELRVYPTFDGLMVYFHDITEKKQRETEREALLGDQVRLREEAERALRERQRAVEVLERGDPVIVVDEDFRVLLVNENQERVSRTRREDTLGRDFWEMFPTVAHPDSKFWTEFHRLMEQRVPVRFDEYYPPLDLWTSVSAYPTSEGGMAAFFRDVTEQKREEQFRERLLGIVSHDLRNPLGSISVTTQLLLRRDGVPEGVQAGVRRIAASADRMQRMISDLLDFTQATVGGGIPLHRRPTSLGQVVRTVLEELELMHPGRFVQTSARGMHDGQWDSDRLAQVVSNLVSNALAYGEDGTPVEVRTWEEAEDSLLSVHNRGRPIPEEQLPRVFDPFKRATREGNRRGLGLGLHIVQQVVRAHGGTITVESREEEGTTFTVRLPRHPLPPGGPG